MPANDRVPNELVRFIDGVEYLKSIRKIAKGRNSTKLDELALREKGVVKAGFDDLRMNLLEASDGFTSRKEIQRRVILKEFIWRIRAGKYMENGG